jgi:hypothetical protein
VSNGYAAENSPDHEAGHPHVDHGFGGIFVSLVVLAQASPTIEPAKCALADPPPRDRDEASADVWTLHDFEFQSGRLSHLRDELSGICAVNPHLLQRRVVRTGFPEHGARTISILHVGTRDAHSEDETHDVDEHMALAALDLLPRIKTAGSTRLGGFHALAVENGSRRSLASPCVRARAFTELVVDRAPDARLLPLVEMMKDDPIRRKIVG